MQAHRNWLEITWIGDRQRSVGEQAHCPQIGLCFSRLPSLSESSSQALLTFRKQSSPWLHSKSPSLPEQGGFGGPYASVAEMIRADSNTPGRPQSSMLSLTYVNIVPMTAFSYPICNCKGIHYFSPPGGKERSWASLLLGKCN